MYQSNQQLTDHKVHVVHFGCRLNQYETDGIYNGLHQYNIPTTQTINNATYIVINTCSVTNKADNKARSIIQKIQKQIPNTKIIVTGCYATTDPQVFRQQLNVHKIVSNTAKSSIPALILQDIQKSFSKVKSKQLEQQTSKINPSSKFHYPYHKKRYRARAYLKIQDGCNKKCSYCKIPHARGKAESRNFDECLKELKHLISLGFQEIIITGVNIGSYSYHKKNFVDLVQALANLPGDYYLRISSIEPPDVTDKVIQLFLLPKIANFLHIPLQSASPSILKKMHRAYTLKKFTDIMQKVSSLHPHIHIGTDIIVGFPSETEELFEETLQYIQKVKFDNIHVFPFSKRKEAPIFQSLQKKEIIEVLPHIIKQRIQKINKVQNIIVTEKIKKTSNIPLKGVILKQMKAKNYQVLTENYIKVELHNSVSSFKIGELIKLKYNKNKQAVLI